MFEAKSLSCRRGMRMIFRDIAFHLSGGSLLQVVGTNGSGKSTLLRVLAGLLPMAGGEVSWQKQSIAAAMDAHRARIHYIGHQDALKPELNAAEMLDYWRALRSGSSLRADFFGIDTFKQKPTRYLSAGQKRRLTLSRLALDDAPLWLLDEPTTALDSEGQILLTNAIAAHRAAGGIVIAAVHHLIDAPDYQTLSMSVSMPGGG